MTIKFNVPRVAAWIVGHTVGKGMVSTPEVKVELLKHLEIRAVLSKRGTAC